MFTALLQPYLAREYPCTCEEFRSTIQKEKRIIDVLEPVMNQHRLIVDPQVIRDDLETTKGLPAEQALAYRLIYQMTRICRIRGSLRHDDRLDATRLSRKLVHGPDEARPGQTGDSQKRRGTQSRARSILQPRQALQPRQNMPRRSFRPPSPAEKKKEKQEIAADSHSLSAIAEKVSWGRVSLKTCVPCFSSTQSQSVKTSRGSSMCMLKKPQQVKAKLQPIRAPCMCMLKGTGKSCHCLNFPETAATSRMCMLKGAGGNHRQESPSTPLQN